jgi:hypothetical protein
VGQHADHDDECRELLDDRDGHVQQPVEGPARVMSVGFDAGGESAQIHAHKNDCHGYEQRCGGVHEIGEVMRALRRDILDANARLR